MRWPAQRGAEHAAITRQRFDPGGARRTGVEEPAGVRRHHLLGSALPVQADGPALLLAPERRSETNQVAVRIPVAFVLPPLEVLRLDELSACFAPFPRGLSSSRSSSGRAYNLLSSPTFFSPLSFSQATAITTGLPTRAGLNRVRARPPTAGSARGRPCIEPSTAVAALPSSVGGTWGCANHIEIGADPLLI